MTLCGRCSCLQQQTLIDLARDRGAFVDQSQSLNLYMAGMWFRGALGSLYSVCTHHRSMHVSCLVQTQRPRACPPCTFTPGSKA